MRLKSAGRRSLLGGLGAVALATAALAMTGTPASAAVASGRVQLCALGNYSADITWSNGLHSYLVPQGECRTFEIVGTEAYIVGGFYNGSGNHFNIQHCAPGPGGYNASTPGTTRIAQGTTTAPTLRTRA
jgi:hypothetical protein